MIGIVSRKSTYPVSIVRVDPRKTRRHRRYMAAARKATLMSYLIKESMLINLKKVHMATHEISYPPNEYFRED